MKTILSCASDSVHRVRPILPLLTVTILHFAVVFGSGCHSLKYRVDGSTDPVFLPSGTLRIERPILAVVGSRDVVGGGLIQYKHAAGDADASVRFAGTSLGEKKGDWELDLARFTIDADIPLDDRGLSHLAFALGLNYVEQSFEFDDAGIDREIDEIAFLLDFGVGYRQMIGEIVGAETSVSYGRSDNNRIFRGYTGLRFQIGEYLRLRTGWEFMEIVTANDDRLEFETNGPSIDLSLVIGLQPMPRRRGE